MKLIIENKETGKVKSLSVERFSWEIFLLGWTFIPYIKYKLKYPIILYSIILGTSFICYLLTLTNSEFLSGLRNICYSTISFNFFISYVLHSYWAALGKRECLRYYLTNGWTIVNNSRAAKIALILLGIIPN